MENGDNEFYKFQSRNVRFLQQELVTFLCSSHLSFQRPDDDGATLAFLGGNCSSYEKTSSDVQYSGEYVTQVICFAKVICK